MLTIGVVAIQGAVSEHIAALEKSSKDLDCKIVTIKRAGIVPHCDGLIIPGGESTTISRILRFEGIDKEILENKSIPMMGTCAGLIIMSDYKNQRVEGLGLIDMQVKRNAFGRQAESFQVPLTVTFFNSPFDGIFIRAPAITQVGDATHVLARFEKYGVAVQQGNKLALAFHPELGNDLRFHRYFLRLFDFDK
ncbi:MAG TPA: pyridoxal 5'-phosphate synthase glutaminase subunit PdxT [Candidatus Bathyarchaeia archaeon]|nr:pyridoxal 5'-phosphate synthase glutaminase subunit PdxT [Candidatus Bathyarchaeia archaeon]